MDINTDSAALLESISSSLLAVTRSANALAAEDLDFYRSLDPSIGTKIDEQNARLLGLAERLLGNAASGAEVVRPRLAGTDAVDENWRGIVDVLDSLLEKADTSLDEYSGAVKRLSPSREQTPTNTPRPSKIAQALKSQELLKPQLTFGTIPANDEVAPFRPLLAKKPHAIVPLEESAQAYEGEDGLQHTSHPYQAEIEQYEFPSFVYTRAEPIMYEPFESTTATFVDTEEAVDEMLEELKQAKEIAIDLEHHDYRTYIGLVSLMQISTRNRDWIVDTLKPWRRKLSVLNEVFANPNIVKVLHGAHMDTIWLQRDLGLYLVGLFDTHLASRVLGYPGGSLAFLLKKFINFDAQKQHQTADWRVRPLSKELFDYARSDTHFLLFIYDNMRNELLDRSEPNDPEQDKILAVLQRSKEVALQTYNHPIYDAERGLGPVGWYRMLSRTPSLLTKEQFAVFRAVHEWRDRIAREQDDSVHYVLANHNIFNIAKEIPLDRAKLLSVAQPGTQTLRLRADEVLSVIKAAKDRAPEEAEMKDTLREIETYLYGEPMIDIRQTPALPPPANAPTAPKADIESASKPLTAPQTALSALRSTISSFWGTTFSSPQKRRASTSSQKPEMLIPLPPLTAEIFAAPSSTPHKPPVPSTTSTPVNTTPVTRNDKKIFTLRDQTSKGEKRKRHPAASAMETMDATHDVLGAERDDGLAGNEDEVSITPVRGDEGKREAKRRRKEERRARRAAKEAQGDAGATRAGLGDGADGEAEAEGEGEGEVEAEGEFDYASAPTVLHAQREMEREAIRAKRDRGGKGKEKDAGKGRQEAFTLAKGLGDVKKGLGRRQKEGGGRSMTFK
ncbi:Exosome complex exonuclease rrp6-like protein [Elsinoe fawcettii]|nr:Exosome complex exonuclease rrp6-like protein [Elsinoe fawcettii]